MHALPDTNAVEDFMVAFGQTVRTKPTADIPNDERTLRARLVLEEALEFVAAMGCSVSANGVPVTKDGVQVDPTQGDGIDLIEATDALADLIVVTKGSALTLGVPVDAAFRVVHDTNMAKLGPDGTPIRREGDGKVLKPDGWTPPTESLRGLLADATNGTAAHVPGTPDTDTRWGTAVDWLLNHRSVAMDAGIVFWAYVDGLITETEMREEMSSDTDEDGLPRSIYAVVDERRVQAEDRS